MFDFKLTNSGDLSLKWQDSWPEAQISWHVSNYPVFNMQFSQQRDYVPEKPADAFMLSFSTSSKVTKNKKALTIVRDTEELKQRIIILLRTEIGSVSFYKELGTQLVKAKHRDIRDSEVINWIHDTVLDAIENLADDLTVEVKAEKRDNYTFYCQNVNVYIYQDGDLLYEFSI